jgi:hypothetical protein
LSKKCTLDDGCKNDAGGGCGSRLVATTEDRLNISPTNRCDALQKVRFWDPEHWRFRAEETRTVADQMTHEEARTIMRRIANDYDRLAKLAEEQLADQERGATGPKT